MNTLIIGLVAGIVGTGYFVYGKRQSKPVPLIAGALLCIYPYFSDSAIWLYGAGALLALAPFVLDF
jgi:hypothetical protein